MAEQTDDPQLMEALRSEVAGWKPYRGADVADLMQHAEHSWRRPVAVASSLGATVLAVLLLLSVLVVALAPAIPGGDTIRAHLVAP